MKVIKNSELQKRRMVFITQKCIMRGVYLPLSHVKTLEKIMHYGNANTNYISALNLDDNTFTTINSSKTCISSLTRFGLIKSAGKGKVKVSTEFFK